MKRIPSLFLAAVLVFLPLVPAVAASRSSHSSHSSKSTKGKKAEAPKCSTCERSAKAKHDFERQSGYPHGRPGYVIDHVKPLECGGADAPSNMQWQTIAAAKAKDRTERACR